MVSVQTLEASSLTFTGHRWAEFRSGHNRGTRLEASKQEIKRIIMPALKARIIVLSIEVPLCLLLSFLGAEPHAQWISGLEKVAQITAHMWKTTDWCYIFYALST